MESGGEPTRGCGGARVDEGSSVVQYQGWELGVGGGSGSVPPPSQGWTGREVLLVILGKDQSLVAPGVGAKVCVGGGNRSATPSMLLQCHP